MADGGGARPEFERGMGFRWPEAVVRVWGAVGRGVALERGAVIVGRVPIIQEVRGKSIGGDLNVDDEGSE
jgi:hypothetical protein